MTYKLSYCPQGLPPGATYKIVGEDPCHFFVTSDRFTAPVLRVPRRAVIPLEEFHLVH